MTVKIKQPSFKQPSSYLPGKQAKNEDVDYDREQQTNSFGLKIFGRIRSRSDWHAWFLSQRKRQLLVPLIILMN